MFRFSDAQSNLIKKLYNNKELSDVRIIIDTLDDFSNSRESLESQESQDPTVGKETIYAHKFLLCISSEYARKIFMRDTDNNIGTTVFKETQTGVMDLSGYDPRLVKLCIQSLYDPDYANTEISSLISDNSETYGYILDLVSYLGLNRLQISLETIGHNMFDRIWMSGVCRLYLINALTYSPGTKKKSLAHKFMRQYVQCINTISMSTGSAGSVGSVGAAGSDDVQQCIDYVEFMQSLDSRQLKQVTKLGTESASDHTSAFRLWTQWYIVNKSKITGAKDIFDKAISRGCVDIKKIHVDKVLDCVLSIKDTVTYGWFITQFPNISKNLKKSMRQSQMK